MAPGSGFETDRAVAHLEFIARHPRPLGSDHHRAVREYLVNEFQSLGLLVEVQDARVPLRRDGTGPRIEIGNVIARLPGTGDGSGKAVVLAAHYDSTHVNSAASRGAGDDGAAVAALLEVARVLTSDRPRNDVIFLITDGEERGCSAPRVRRRAPVVRARRRRVQLRGARHERAVADVPDEPRQRLARRAVRARRAAPRGPARSATRSTA